MRPDEDHKLITIGKGPDTCELCMKELYPNIEDKDCLDCNLNPIKKIGLKKLIKEASEHEAAFRRGQLLQRYNNVNNYGSEFVEKFKQDCPVNCHLLKK